MSGQFTPLPIRITNLIQYLRLRNVVVSKNGLFKRKSSDTKSTKSLSSLALELKGILKENRLILIQRSTFELRTFIEYVTLHSDSIADTARV